MNKLAAIHANLMILTALILIISGCVQKNRDKTDLGTEMPVITEVTAVTTNEIKVSSTDIVATITNTKEVLNDNLCHWPPQEVTSKPEEFLWSNDSKRILYFDKKMQSWAGYDIGNDLILEPTRSDLDQIAAENLSDNQIAQEFDVKDYFDLYLSSTRDSLVYTLSISEGLDVYFVRLPDKHPIFLGHIKELIDNIYWINNGDTILISTDWQAVPGTTDAHLYIADLAQKKIQPLIPNTHDYRNTSILGITPDEEWVLFVRYSGDDRSVWLLNIQDQVLAPTNILPPITYKWISDHEIIAVGHLDLNEPTEAYIYDFHDHDTRKISEYPLLLYKEYFDGVVISPDFKHIAFIGQDLILYYLDCSNLALQ